MFLTKKKASAQSEGVADDVTQMVKRGNVRPTKSTGTSQKHISGSTIALSLCGLDAERAVMPIW